MAAQASGGVPLSTLAPKYLHTNSTSHTWPFGAIAELIDNAYDPDVSAKQFWIDKTIIKEKLCLTFMDNGNGLDHETMHKMLSFGYSDKTAIKGHVPIGMYGNGFKSGSMRLGKDAIVFSKSESGMCIGMLSQTYLGLIGADQIQIPIVCITEKTLSSFSVREEHRASLQDILCYSLFKTRDELLAELDAITSSFSQTGTRIIIWNLRRTATDAPEFDFETDPYDIRIPSEVYEAIGDSSKVSDRMTSHIPETVYSLRAYCSILYLKPRMQVVLRGKTVKTVLIAKSLACMRKDFYKPIFLNKRIPIHFGFNTKSKDQYGVMMYHKNRLIKAYERVGCQLKANYMGVGVIGIIECNFLDPTHNKQSFIESDKYRKTMNNLGVKLEEYWKEMQHRRKKENPNNSTPVEDTMKRPDQNWVQCNGCLKWRKLPDGIDCDKLPEEWFCRMNPDPQFRSCNVEEEPEDSVDEQSSYRKTYKEQEREDKMKKEKIEQARQILEQQEKERFAAIAAQNNALKKQHDKLRRQLRQMSPSTSSNVGSSPLLEGAVRAVTPPLTTTTISQAAMSPSLNNGLPVVTVVSSVSANLPALKRAQPSPLSTPKRPRVDLPHRISGTLAELQACSTPKPVDDVSKPHSEKTTAETGRPTVTVSGTEESQSLTEGNQIVESNRETHVEKSTTEVQKQQDDLLKLLQDTVQERDGLKKELQKVTCQLREMQKKLSEERDYKSLFERVKQKVQDLMKDKQALIAAAGRETTLSAEDKDVDEISLQVGCLVQELDKRNKELDELRLQLDTLEEERSSLAAECEELRCKVQQQADATRNLHFPASHAEKPGASAEPDEARRSLIELRQNVGRLLVSSMTLSRLELDQVNYECNVIDEILEQYLSSLDSN